MAKLHFPRLHVPTLAAIVAVAITFALGNWQLNRGHEKAALAAQIAAANRSGLVTLPAQEVKADDLAFHRVEVSGRFEPKYAVFIDNRVLNGVVGYEVVMPLEIEGSGRYVLINRGWVAAGEVRTRLPAIATPTQPVRVVGLAMVPTQRFLELSKQVEQGNVWENLTLERYRAAFPIALQPIVIQQENDLGDGLQREWPAPDFGIEMHYGYAFQWYAMAIAIMVIYGINNVRKRRLKPH